MAVSTAKELMKKGLTTFYVRSGDYPRIRQIEGSLGHAQACVIDDLNSHYGVEMGLFKKAVLNTYERGGRIFVTSNTDYHTLMENAFITDPQEKPRYMDRTKGMFKVLRVEGSSHRQENAWFNVVLNEEFNPKTRKDNK